MYKVGKICKYHKKGKGLRYLNHNQCVYCKRKLNTKSRIKRRNIAKNREYIGKICKYHPELKGRRTVAAVCLGCIHAQLEHLYLCHNCNFREYTRLKKRFDKNRSDVIYYIR